MKQKNIKRICLINYPNPALRFSPLFRNYTSLSANLLSSARSYDEAEPNKSSLIWLSLCRDAVFFCFHLSLVTEYY